ncbi:hypothetical protein [Albimonas pacifica]|uniref:ASCH domain-containing protein n=1 Tax=Albimonas pacifica TaxID=1114924 RepID=A0A1I3FVH7_9RHOB|nr:hypothetical protein [Albimonas pacifica]SFI15154.1 hypothetical protein SAMN05216258_104541 [Albimonas pacifica]
MTDRPIIFSGPMVRALLEGRKTQTRRALPTAHPKFANHGVLDPEALTDPLEVWYWDGVHDRVGASYRLPYAPSNRLWVRETFAHDCDGVGCAYRADGESLGWTSPLFMPRRLSRLTLTVTDVRVQRVQEIIRGDAMEEGCPFPNMADGPDPRDWFRELWDSLNAKRGLGWEANPWVAALTFEVHRCNIDKLEAGDA